MADKEKIAVVLPDEIRKEMEELRKEKYSDLSEEELCRKAIAAGLKEIRKKNHENSK